MSRVIIDTSTIVNFEKVYSSIERFTDSDKIIDANPINVHLVDLIENVIEACLFYDEVIFDKSSVKKSIGHSLALPIFDLPYCSFIETTEQSERKIYEEIIKSFSLSSDKIKSIAGKIPIDWAPFFDPHDNLSIKGFLYKEAKLGSYYSAYIHEFVQCLQNEDYEGLHMVPETVVYEIVRYLYYVYLQNKESAQLVVHPSRDILPYAIGYGNRNRFDWLINRPNEILHKKIANRFHYHIADTIPIPFIASYILTRIDSSRNLFEVIDDVRNSKEAKRFRTAFNTLIHLIESNQAGELDSVMREYEKTLMMWETNLNAVPGFRSKSLTITLPFVSFEAEIPYIGGNKIARNLLTFIHKTMLNQEKYSIYSRLLRDYIHYR